MKKIIISFYLSLLFQLLFCQPEKADSSRMQWFFDAKLGIFMHWGIYAVNGTTESWAFFNNEVPYDEYMAQAKGFTASKYIPEDWAKLFKEAGAKYAVLTSKHHDGFALWDTKLSDLNVVKATPAKRDLIGPYCNAMKKEGLKVGIYFSHLDWSHPDYASVVPRKEILEEKRNKYSYPPKGKEDIFKWERFLSFHHGQLKELCTNYKPDLLWFDGDWERDDIHWKMKDLKDSLFRWKPGVIVNSRMRGYGDYETPEQTIPIQRPSNKWELCITMNDSWGYRQSDTNYKSVRELIRTFVDVIGNGGNLLLDIGPMENGVIPEPQVYRLKEIGKWIRKHNEAVYPIIAGLPYGHFYGPTSLTKDKKTIYLYLTDKTTDFFTLKGIRNKIKTIRVVGTKEILTYKRSGGASWINAPGMLVINSPKQYDEYVTVIAIELETTLDLYTASGFEKHIIQE